MSTAPVIRSPSLVEGRSCGYCTVCCSALLIDTPEFQKRAGILCEHCTGRGCGIYEKRPPACRGFYCGWWVLPQLSDDWRPDKSGVLILPQKDNIPPAYAGREGMQLLMHGGEPAIRQPGFVEFAIALVNTGIPTFIVAPGPPGHSGVWVFLNERLGPAAKNGDRAAALQALLIAYRDALTQPFEPSPLTHERA